MRRAVRVVFGLLVIATFSAFFVAQRLKNSPPVIQQFSRTPVFSPNQDGRLERATVSFKLKESDRITVAVVDVKGDHMAELVNGRRADAGVLQRFKWDGRTDAGTRARDGIYRYRVTLHRQGRSALVQKSVRLDVTPPRPAVTSIGPFRRPGPELLPLPDEAEAEVHLSASGRAVRVLLFKTAPGAPRLVDTWGFDAPPTVWRWNGRTRDGQAASSGTYLVVVEARDRAGNIGRSVKLDRHGLPVASYGVRLGGRGGITVRYLAVRPQAAPAWAGELVRFFVDSRQQPYTWKLRRLGSSQVLRRSKQAKTSPRLSLFAPAGRSGVYLLEVRAGSHTTRTPFVVDGRERSPVLVVLPAMTWQGRNPVDDDGDGMPDLLDRGLAVKTDRMLVGDGLPAGFAQREALLLGWLDRSGHHYDVTTDIALARGQGQKLAGHQGVILPGDTRWLPRATVLTLRSFVRDGGTLASLGIDSLRRQVSVRRGSLVDPTPPASTDVFGGRLRRVQRLAAPATLVNASDSDDVRLFEGTTGSFAGFSTLQELEPTPELLSSAIVLDPPTDRPVIAAARLGRGLVLRYPLPELPAKLTASSPDQQAVALLERAWTLLSR